jgi:hypothetical protein
VLYLDTLQQIESHLLMRHYDGLMKSGRIKGRSNPSAVRDGYKLKRRIKARDALL